MKEQFIIRHAEISDAEDIFYINKTSLGYDYSLDKQRNKLKTVLSDCTQIVFVADIDGKVVGYIHLANYDLIYADNLKNCLGIAVDNDYRRIGLASTLLKQAEFWAKANGAVGIRINSGIEREIAHKFYLSQGYVENKLQKNLKKIF